MHDDDVVDSNVFIHAQIGDHLAPECIAFPRAHERGEIVAQLPPLVVHELTYILPRSIHQMTRADVATYVLHILTWPGITGEREILSQALRRWQRTPGLGFVDAYLAARARAGGRAVFTKNVREFRTRGVTVPDPFPGGVGGNGR